MKRLTTYRTGLDYSMMLACSAMLWLLCPGAAWADPVLEINSASLTDYKPTVKTNVQDVRPLPIQRSAMLDGSPLGNNCNDPVNGNNPGSGNGGGFGNGGGGGGGGGNGNGGFYGSNGGAGGGGGGGGDTGGTVPGAPGGCVFPFCHPKPGGGIVCVCGGPAGAPAIPHRLAGVELAVGTAPLSAADLSLPAPGFQWTIGRTYNSRQKDNTPAYFDSGGFQGKNWFQSSLPELVYYNPANDANDMVYLVFGADEYIEFKWDSNGTTPNDISFKAVNGAQGAIVVTINSSAPDIATYTNHMGMRMSFFWIGDGDIADDKEGILWKITDPAGNVAHFGDSTGDDSSASSALSDGYESDGRPKYALDSADRRYYYQYDGSSRLASVTVQTWTGSAWAATGDLVEYDYYADFDISELAKDEFGNVGALRMVTITTPLSDSGIELVRKKYYRYYTDYDGGYHATNNPGYPYQVRMIVDFEGTRAFDYPGDSTFDDDFLTASYDDLKPFASGYFKYDSERRVVSAWSGGACGCSGGTGNGEFTFEYEDNNQYSNDSGYDSAETEWATRTTIKRPDNSYVVQYFDEVAQPLHTVITAADPDTNPASEWCTRVLRDSGGRVTTINSPENVTAYTHAIGGSWGFTLDDDAGLITTFTRETSGDLTGFVLSAKHQTGTGGDAYLDRTFTYSTRGLDVGGVTVTRPLVASSRVYSEEVTSGTSGSYLTSYSYTFHSGTSTNVLYVAAKTVTTTNPTVSTGTNGSNSSTSSVAYLRADGTTAFTQSPDGTFTYTRYTNGQLVKTIQDAQTDHGTDFAAGDDPNTNFGITETGDGLRHITTMEYDDQGRSGKTTRMAQNLGTDFISTTYYSRLKDRRLVTLRYAQYDDSGEDPIFYGPVQYTVANLAGRVEAQATVKLTSNESDDPTTAHIDETTADLIAAMDLGTIARLSTSLYNESGTQLEESRAYFLIPGSSPGAEGTNFDATLFAYDGSGRQIRAKDPTGTITRTNYDSLGRVSSSEIGTNDNGDPGGDVAGTNNMVVVSSMEYDGGGVGNGKVTTRTAYIQDSSTGQRQVTMLHDVRGRAIVQVNPVAPHTVNKYDNMGRLIASAQYSSSSGLDAGDDPTSLATNRLALSQTFFDAMGRVWKTQRHKIDQADGSDDDNLQSLTWYDAEGRVIKVDGEQLAKTAYDRLGRVIHQYVLAVDDDAGYGDVDDVTGDVVLSQSDTVYDADTGDVIMTARIDRFHDDHSGGETTGPLDTNGDADDLLYTAANVLGRTQITAMWHDRFGRVTDTVFYGQYDSNDDGALDNFDRDGLSVPARSDTALRTTTTYNTDGSVQQVQDPKALITFYEYDDAGRQVTVISNYVNGSPSGLTADDDAITRFVYVDGLRTKLWVDIYPADTNGTPDGEDQVTTYTYGVVKGTDPGESLFANNRLLQKVAYPDSASGTDVVSFAYNAQGQQVWMKDQAGNIIQSDYDTGGRMTHKRATTIVSGFDGHDDADAVKRISYAYDGLGRTSTVTQYDEPIVGDEDEDVLDEVKYTYNDWGLVSAFEQDRDSTVGGGGNQYTASYTYEVETSGRNTVRMKELVLPPGNKTVTYGHRITGGSLHDDEVSRPATVKVGVTTVAEYQYNGLAQVVATNYPEPDVMSNQFGATGLYPDLDRFNRVATSRWTKDLGTDKDFYVVSLGYDRNSNITFANEVGVHAGFDVKYTIDDMNRLTKAEEGTYSGGSISSRTRQQIWTLDQVGNWSIARLDLNGDNDFIDGAPGTDHDDSRSHNLANELIDRDFDDDGDTSYDDTHYDLIYDAVGNLTDDGVAYAYQYDPFGRLRYVFVTGTSTVKAEYRYNGLGYRIGFHEDTDNDNDVDGSDQWYYSAYDVQWRNVATFRGSDSNPKEQFVYHASASSKLDDLILRERDMTNGWTGAADGTLEQRHYFCQNWRGDVVAVVTSGGAQVEQVRYSSYGIAFGMAAGDVDSDGDVDAADATQIQAWIDAPSYDVRGDLDLDGDVDATDKTICQSNAGNNLGWGKLSLTAVGNRKGYAGYERDMNLPELCHVRHRVLNTTLGRWTRRDPAGSVDGANFYNYVRSNPVLAIDPFGLKRLVAILHGQDFFGIPSLITHSGGSLRKLAEELDVGENTVRQFQEDADYSVFSNCGNACQWIDQQQDSACGSCSSNTKNVVVLIGHSNGGDGARKVAKQLQSKGHRVRLLFLFDPIHKPVHHWDQVYPVTNTEEAVNYYQRTATFSFTLPFLPTFHLWGYQIAPGTNHFVPSSSFQGPDVTMPGIQWGPHQAVARPLSLHGVGAYEDAVSRVNNLPTVGDPCIP